MQEKNGVAAMGAMTAAIKTQRLLAELGIETRIVSLSPGDTRLGCAYGIEYSLADEGRVKQAMHDARVTVSQYLRRGGTPL